jgi:hypothetical protein
LPYATRRSPAALLAGLSLHLTERIDPGELAAMNTVADCNGGELPDRKTNSVLPGFLQAVWTMNETSIGIVEVCATTRSLAHGSQQV